jgi:hypothetical protein
MIQVCHHEVTEVVLICISKIILYITHNTKPIQYWLLILNAGKHN